MTGLLPLAPAQVAFLQNPAPQAQDWYFPQWVGPSVPISNRENAHRPLWQRLFLKGGEVPSSQLSLTSDGQTMCLHELSNRR